MLYQTKMVKMLKQHRRRPMMAELILDPKPNQEIRQSQTNERISELEKLDPVNNSNEAR
jgi:hypothetical protein